LRRWVGDKQGKKLTWILGKVECKKKKNEDYPERCGYFEIKKMDKPRKKGEGGTSRRRPERKNANTQTGKKIRLVGGNITLEGEKVL